MSAQGTVVAAVSPTLFAAAPGTVHFLVQAGDTVKKDQPLASVDSPELRNELQREQATLASMEIVARECSIRRKWMSYATPFYRSIRPNRPVRAWG